MMDDESLQVEPKRYSRISAKEAWLGRRVCAVLLSAWLGGIALVALGAPAVFQASDVVLRQPLPAHAEIVKRAGLEPVRGLLRYHAGEANNQVFLLWGTMQIAYGAAVLFVLLFFTDAGRCRLGLAAALLALALFQKLYLIPAIADASRRFRAGGLAEAGRRFQHLHGSFAAFELVSALLALALLVLLLRSRRSGVRRSPA